MKKFISLHSLFLLITLNLFSQPATDIDCIQNVFYGNASTGVRQMEMVGNTIVDLGLTANPPSTFINSLGYGNDITQNSGNRTFYASSSLGGSPFPILRWTGTVWDTITTDTMVYHNCGAYGRFVYFHHTTSTSPNDQCISRLNSNGTLTRIFTDTTLLFSVADLAVDTAGNIYCFRGQGFGQTTELTVISPNGTILNSYATTLNNMSAIFGCMFLNGILYIGQGTTNSQLFPVTFSGTTATLGAAIPMNLSMNDLTGCHKPEGKITGLGVVKNENKFFVKPDDRSRNIQVFNNTNQPLSVKMFNMKGQLCSSFIVNDSYMESDISELTSGLYIVHMITSGNDLHSEKILVLH